MRLRIAAALAGALAFSGPAWTAPVQDAAPPSAAAPPLAANGVFNRLAAASVRASRAAGHLITIESSDYSPLSAELTVAAVRTASEAIEQLAQAPDGRRQMVGLSEIRIIDGQAPRARLANGALILTIDVAMGSSGGPSSDQIILAISH